MRATDLIRHVLDLIDTIEKSGPVDVEELEQKPAKKERATRKTKHANTPDEIEYGVDLVTKDMGGGPNKPKHPADLRGDSNSLYPTMQYDPYKRFY